MIGRIPITIEPAVAAIAAVGTVMCGAAIAVSCAVPFKASLGIVMIIHTAFSFTSIKYGFKKRLYRLKVF